jgi:hypothetical protein
MLKDKARLEFWFGLGGFITDEVWFNACVISVLWGRV